MQAAEQQGLEAVKKDSFQQITDQANRRGLFYSGLPIAEEQKYTASSFLPAVANLRSRYTTQKFNLQDAISKIAQDQYSKGQEIYQTELNRDEEQRQFNERLRASSAASGSGGTGYASPSFGGGYTEPTPTPAGGGQVQGQYTGMALRVPGNPGAGFAFRDGRGNQANALQYSQAQQIPFRTLLQQMANAGDSGARTALQFVGDDGNADPRKVTSPALANLYTALTGRRVGVSRPSGPSTGFPGSPGASNSFNQILTRAR